jgi:hypothetical protein
MVKKYCCLPEATPISWEPSGDYSDFSVQDFHIKGYRRKERLSSAHGSSHGYGFVEDLDRSWWLRLTQLRKDQS